MSVHIMSPLAARLEDALRLVDTLILRTKSGQVYTIEIGETLFTGSHAYGAMVTMTGEISRHIGVCHGSTLEQVVIAAQQMVSDAISESFDEMAPASHEEHAATITF